MLDKGGSWTNSIQKDFWLDSTKCALVLTEFGTVPFRRSTLRILYFIESMHATNLTWTYDVVLILHKVTLHRNIFRYWRSMKFATLILLGIKPLGLLWIGTTKVTFRIITTDRSYRDKFSENLNHKIHWGYFTFEFIKIHSY